MPRPHRPDPVRSRFVVVGTAASFFAAQLALGLWLDRAPPEVRFSDASGVFERLDTLGRLPDAVVVGSSRLGFALDADQLQSDVDREIAGPAPRVLKATMPAGDGIAHDWLWPRLIARGVAPRLAIIEISPESVVPYNRWLNIHLTRQFTWADIAHFLPDIARRGAFSRLLATRLTPFYRYRFELLRYAVGTPPPYLRAPVPAREEKLDEAQALARARIGTQKDMRGIRKWLRNYAIGGNSKRAFESTVARLANLGAQIVFVEAPVTRAYAELYTPEIDAAFDAYLEDLVAQHDAAYVDLRDVLDDDRFIDSHHANERGRAEFTARFAHEVLAPAWRGELSR